MGLCGKELIGDSSNGAHVIKFICDEVEDQVEKGENASNKVSSIFSFSHNVSKSLPFLGLKLDIKQTTASKDLTFVGLLRVKKAIQYKFFTTQSKLLIYPKKPLNAYWEKEKIPVLVISIFSSHNDFQKLPLLGLLIHSFVRNRIA